VSLCYGASCVHSLSLGTWWYEWSLSTILYRVVHPLLSICVLFHIPIATTSYTQLPNPFQKSSTITRQKHGVHPACPQLNWLHAHRTISRYAPGLDIALEILMNQPRLDCRCLAKHYWECSSREYFRLPSERHHEQGGGWRRQDGRWGIILFGLG